MLLVKEFHFLKTTLCEHLNCKRATLLSVLVNELLIFDEFVTSKSPETLHDGTVVSLYTVCSLQIFKKEEKKLAVTLMV